MTVFVEPGAEVVVQPPRPYVSEITGGPGRVPWVVDVMQNVGTLELQVESRELLTGLRDAITGALDANPDAS